MKTWSLMKGFVPQNGKFLLPSARGYNVRAMEPFHKAEELKIKIKMCWKVMCYLQDSKVLESSKVRLGDPGDIISVQVTEMERKFG